MAIYQEMWEKETGKDASQWTRLPLLSSPHCQWGQPVASLRREIAREDIERETATT